MRQGPPVSAAASISQKWGHPCIATARKETQNNGGEAFWKWQWGQGAGTPAAGLHGAGCEGGEPPSGKLQGDVTSWGRQPGPGCS